MENTDPTKPDPVPAGELTKDPAADAAPEKDSGMGDHHGKRPPDEGKKDEGKKDEGKKDEGKKDAGK